MSICTPRGLEIKLSVPYTFTLMQRIYPTVDAFKVLKLTEGLQSIPSLFAFATALLCFCVKVATFQIVVFVFCATVAGTLLTLWGFVFPGLPFVATLYSYVSGFGILFVGLLVYGFVAVGLRGVLAFSAGRLAAGLVSWILEVWNGRRLYRRTGVCLCLPEINFLNAYRLYASETIASPPIAFQEFKRRLDTSLTQDEMKVENWKPCFMDLALQWPKVVARFREPDDGLAHLMSDEITAQKLRTTLGSIRKE